jgi:alpha-galactosidase
MKLLLSAALLGVTPPIFAEPVWLSWLNLKEMTTGWSGAKADHEISGGPLSIDGEKFAHGVGTHANSKFRMALNGNATRFTAEVGVDDSAGAHGSVEFTVIGDGKTLWASGVLVGGEAAKPVNVNLAGIRTLVLRVTDGGDGESYDHADWADAKIDMDSGAPPPVALPPYETFSLKTKNFAIKFQVGDDGWLSQFPIGMADPGVRLPRDDEFYPQAGDGYVWEPALQVVHADGNTSTALIYDGLSQTNESPDIELIRIHLHDPAYPFEVTLCFRTHYNEDVIEEWTEICHRESGSVTLQRMTSTSLLLTTNVYLTHFFGDWSKEMLAPITEKLTPGIKVLDSKLGVRADQFQNPNFILMLNGKATETNGEVLGGCLAWSGSFQCEFDNNGQGIRALCGVNPFASAYYLKPGNTFITPRMIWVWSNHGLGDMSRKLDRWARDFGMRDGHLPRPVLLNNWEATGFNFDFDRIADLFAPAKAIGAELFLLDDGWFGNKYPRVSDDAGLGDWQANRKRFPLGLAPLAAEAVNRGLRFGIWMEPEMVNPNSELFHAHPNWVIRQPKRELELQRNQLVLDLTRPAVQDFEWNTIQSILSVRGITYAKWDCNRYLTQPGSSYLGPARQSELWIDYVNALYTLMHKTATAFPDTELMLCSGGGGRVDYGALKYFDEFWPSDNTDPVTRVLMQWDYSYFFPPMAIASHVTLSGDRSMHFACSVAMSACFGMDLDLNKIPTKDKALLTRAIAAYKQIRDVIADGDLYRLEDPHDNFRGALDYVSKDRRRAVIFVFQLKDGEFVPVRPQGLDPAAEYTIHELNPAPGRAEIPQEGRKATGTELMRDGILPSCADAVEACVIELDSADVALSESK